LPPPLAGRQGSQQQRSADGRGRLRLPQHPLVRRGESLGARGLVEVRRRPLVRAPGGTSPGGGGGRRRGGIGIAQPRGPCGGGGGGRRRVGSLRRGSAQPTCSSRSEGRNMSEETSRVCARGSGPAAASRRAIVRRRPPRSGLSPGSGRRRFEERGRGSGSP